ncbi:MAG: outer membrane beta-barrel protein [Chitinophagales bacterium]
MNGITYTQSVVHLATILRDCRKGFLMFIGICFLLLSFSHNLLAQDETESKAPKLKEAIRKAVILFDEGYPQKVPPLLKRSLGSGSHLKADEVRAYELLTTAYLFLKEEENADSAYLELLDHNPAYLPNEESTTRDLVYFSDGFITYPKFAIGFKIGVNTSNAQTLDTYTVGNDLLRDEGYSQRVGFQVGLHLYYALTRNILGLVVEPSLSSRGYSYSEHLESLIPNGGSVDMPFLDNALIEAPEKQLWLDFPVLLRATLGPPHLKFYVETGLAANFLLKSEFNEIRTGNETLKVNLIKESMRNTSNISLIAGVGLNYRAKYNYLTIGIQYQNMLQNLVRPENRFQNDELIYKFGLVENNLAMSSLGLSIGFIKPFYTSKKRKRFQFVER